MSSAENEQIKSYEVNAAVHTKGIKNEDVVKYYSTWSEKYEQDLNPNLYRGPEIAADICDIFIVNKEAKIVDIGSGTGFVGDNLKIRGFKNVDALEPSDGMVEVSKRKGVYTNYFVEPINAEKPTGLAESRIIYSVLKIIMLITFDLKMVMMYPCWQAAWGKAIFQQMV